MTVFSRVLEKSHITVSRLARELQGLVSHSYIRTFKNTGECPDSRKLMHIADAMGVEYFTLLGDYLGKPSVRSGPSVLHDGNLADVQIRMTVPKSDVENIRRLVARLSARAITKRGLPDQLTGQPSSTSNHEGGTSSEQTVAAARSPSGRAE
jgi:hypothetical protein